MNILRFIRTYDRLTTTTVVHFVVEIIFSHCWNELITTQWDRAIHDTLNDDEGEVIEEEMGKKWGEMENGVQGR